MYQMNAHIYAFALRNTRVNHIRGCVVTTLYPTLPRFKSNMALVWDRSIITCPSTGPVSLGLGDGTKVARWRH